MGFAEEKRIRTINNSILIAFIFVHISYELWGVRKTLFNEVLFNSINYAFTTYVFYKLWRLDKDFLLLACSIVMAYFTITELWTGLTF